MLHIAEFDDELAFILKLLDVVIIDVPFKGNGLAVRNILRGLGRKRYVLKYLLRCRVTLVLHFVFYILEHLFVVKFRL